MTWEEVLKEEFEQHEEWSSDDGQATGNAHLKKYENWDGEWHWMIDEFGIEDTGKGKGQTYLEEFLEHLESVMETGNMALVGTMANKAVSFWERMEAEGLVLV
tara:strand:- start:262 stop:570 length:309 start_codon:yes stop_codon:yes gene_type:complete